MFLKLLLITLCISTSLYASDNNNINTEMNTNLNLNNIETYFNLRELMQSADFSFNDKDNEIIATFSDNPDNRMDNNFHTINRTIMQPKANIQNASIQGYYDDQNETLLSTPTDDKYLEAYFIMGRQEQVSLLNYKLNNNYELNNVENNLVNSLENIKYNRFGDNKRMQWVVPITKHILTDLKLYDSKPCKITDSLYLDISDIVLKNKKINNSTEQLKLDIYRQKTDETTTGPYQYDDAFNIAYNYILNKRFPKNNTKTYFKLRDLMQKADFSIQNNNIVATFSKNPEEIVDESNYETSENVHYHICTNSLEGEINNKEDDNKDIHRDGVADIYDKARLLISNQEALSVLNYKLNNNLQLNDTERSIFNNIYNIKYNKFEDEKINSGIINTVNRRLRSSVKFSQFHYDLLKIHDKNPYKDSNTLYEDVNKILNNNKVNDSQEQLKLDIWRQMEDAKKQKYKYDDAFKVTYKYFMNTYNKQIHNIKLLKETDNCKTQPVTVNQSKVFDTKVTNQSTKLLWNILQHCLTANTKNITWCFCNDHKIHL